MVKGLREGKWHDGRAYEQKIAHRKTERWLVAFPDQVTPQALFRFRSRGYSMRCPGLRQTTKRPSGEDDINSGHHQWLCLTRGECHTKAQERGTIHKRYAFRPHSRPTTTATTGATKRNSGTHIWSHLWCTMGLPSHLGRLSFDITFHFIP